MALPTVAVVFIVFAALFAAYVLLGSLVRYRGGLHHCPEMLPNYQFWCRVCGRLLRLVTCGRYHGPLLYDHAALWGGVEGVTALPSRPATMRDVRFETLLSDEEFSLDDRRATQPAEVVVKF